MTHPHVHSGPRARLAPLGRFTLAALLAVSVAVNARAQVPATLLLHEGDVIDGETVTLLSNPMSTPSGQVGNLVRFQSGAHGIWLNGGLVWLSSQATQAFSSPTEGLKRFGFTDGGAFIYTVNVMNLPSLWSNLGLVAERGQATPGVPGATLLHFARPTMAPNGEARWIAYFDSNADGFSDGMVLYRSSDATLANATVVLKTGDTVSGAQHPLTQVGVGLDYTVSNNGAHYISLVRMANPAGLPPAGIVVDGALVVQEGVTPDGSGNLHRNLDMVDINDDGDYVFSGNTFGTTISDEFMGYNGAVILRERQMVAGRTLTSPATVQALSINDAGAVAYIWYYGGFQSLFFADNADDLVGTSRVLLTRGEYLDFDGDDVGDARVSAFSAGPEAGPGVNLANERSVVVRVWLDYEDGTAAKIALVRVGLGSCGDGVLDANELCDDGYTDGCGSCNATCDAIGSGSTCGDGDHCMETELCDDGNSQSADGCSNVCVPDEVGGGTDAGVDGGGVDAGGSVGGGDAGVDAGETDGGGVDAVADAGYSDSGGHPDSASARDVGTVPPHIDAGAPSPGEGAGCGCRANNDTPPARGVLSLLALVLWVSMRSRRRSRARRERDSSRPSYM